ncbi:uncharacterized protein LAJ45_03288 [Morchella importuna]|uniref:uncharacterized protein n=1 Tax=Morchella importuna TaxID=1174673 RepID=UPI001E8DD0C0|nr:uncharacterized protein LAJ45_03288 [Morchella importuna]KAH8152448.1 hypothetical protein LAJ45_03288 [Morchella importuna]
MSILDSESFESYFTTDADSSPSASPCNIAKGRYDTCFFKSYSEKYQRGESHSTEKCESLFNEYKSCLSKTLKSPPSPPPPQITRVRETDPWKRMTSSK